MASRGKAKVIASLDDSVRSDHHSVNRRPLQQEVGRGSFAYNRSVGFEKIGAKQLPRDLRQSLILKRKFSSSSGVVDPRERITKKTRIKDTKTPQNVKLTVQVQREDDNKGIHTVPRSEKRSLDFSGGSLKITTKQQLRSAESTADGSLVVTAKNADYKNPERRRTADLSDGKLAITTKNSYPKTPKTPSRGRPPTHGDDLIDSRETEGLRGRLGPESEHSSRTSSAATRITVSNLHPLVTITDIEELFGAVGQLKSCRLLQKGMAEVVYSKKEDAVNAHTRYHNRNLDGQPMLCKLSTLPSVTQYVPPANRPLPPLPPVTHTEAYYPSQPTKSDSHHIMHTNPVPSRPVVFKVRI